jgi:hypothetical protein
MVAEISAEGFLRSIARWRASSRSARSVPQLPHTHKLGHVDILCDEVWLYLSGHTCELIRSELKFVFGGGPAYAVDRINTSSRFGAGVNAARQNKAWRKLDGSRCLKPDCFGLHLWHYVPTASSMLRLTQFLADAKDREMSAFGT